MNIHLSNQYRLDKMDKRSQETFPGKCNTQNTLFTYFIRQATIKS